MPRGSMAASTMRPRAGRDAAFGSPAATARPGTRKEARARNPWWSTSRYAHRRWPIELWAPSIALTEPPAQGRERGQRDGIVRLAGRDGMRAKARDDHLGAGDDVQPLTVDAAALEHPERVVRDPPHIAIGIARQQRVSRELRGVGAAPDVGDDRGGDHLPTRPSALTAQQLAETRQIAQGRAQAAAAHGHADGIDDQIAVLLAADPGPDALAQHLGKAHAGDAMHDPAQHFGVDGFVVEHLPVLSRLAQSHQVLVVIAGPRIVRTPCAQAPGARVVPDLRTRIFI